jgi:hypothetical protein
MLSPLSAEFQHHQYLREQRAEFPELTTKRCAIPSKGCRGSSFSWEIVSYAGGFDANFRVDRTMDGHQYAEAGERHTLSRDSAVVSRR